MQTITRGITEYLHPTPAEGLKLAGGPADTKDDSVQLRVREACRQFEGFWLGEMLKAMREAGGEREGLVPVSRAEKIFVRQQCETLGDILAEQEPLGIARLLGSNIHSNGFNGGGRDEDRDLQLQPVEPSGADELKRAHRDGSTN